MKKNIINYGLIAGIVVSFLMLFTVNYITHCEGNIDYDTSMLIGYASMLIAFSLVFVAFAITGINTMKELSVLAKHLN